MRSITATAAVALACAAVAAVPATGARTALSAQDRRYLTTAGHGDHYEIAVGQMSMQRGGSAAIRTLGKALYRDHNRNLKQLQALARKLSFRLPDGPDAAQSRELRAFAAARTKAQLDRAVATAQVASHRQAIADAMKEVAEGRTASVKALARNSLPMLRSHLRLAQAAQRAG